MLTVRELLGSLEVELLAGTDQLDAPVRWVHITELRDPTPWLSGGELILTTGLQLDTAKRQREFVNRLADHQLAGLGIGTGFAHETVPKALLAAARERDFPVFEVPYELPFIAVTEAAFTRLVNEQYAVLRRSIAAHERLERIVLEERGLEAVVAALASLIGGAVVVADARGEPLVRHTFRRPRSRTSAASCGRAREAASARPSPPATRTSRGGRWRYPSPPPAHRRRGRTAMPPRHAPGWWPPRTRGGSRSSTGSPCTRP